MKPTYAELAIENDRLQRRVAYLERQEAESDAPCETAEEYRRRLTAMRCHIARIGRDMQRAGDALVKLGEESA